MTIYVRIFSFMSLWSFYFHPFTGSQMYTGEWDTGHAVERFDMASFHIPYADRNHRLAIAHLVARVIAGLFLRSIEAAAIDKKAGPL